MPKTLNRDELHRLKREGRNAVVMFRGGHFLATIEMCSTCGKPGIVSGVVQTTTPIDAVTTVFPSVYTDDTLTPGLRPVADGFACSVCVPVVKKGRLERKQTEPNIPAPVVAAPSLPVVDGYVRLPNGDQILNDAAVSRQLWTAALDAVANRPGAGRRLPDVPGLVSRQPGNGLVAAPILENVPPVFLSAALVARARGDYALELPAVDGWTIPGDGAVDVAIAEDDSPVDAPAEDVTPGRVGSLADDLGRFAADLEDVTTRLGYVEKDAKADRATLDGISDELTALAERMAAIEATVARLVSSVYPVAVETPTDAAKTNAGEPVADPPTP